MRSPHLCRHPDAGNWRGQGRRRLENSCARLSEQGHGTWYFHCSATNLLGRRERVRRGGYPSQAAGFAVGGRGSGCGPVSTAGPSGAVQVVPPANRPAEGATTARPPAATRRPPDSSRSTRDLAMQAPTGNLPTAAPEQLDLPAPSVCRARCAALPVAAFEHVLGSRLEALGRMPAPPALVPSDIVRLSQQYVWPSSRRPVLRNAGPARARQ